MHAKWLSKGWRRRDRENYVDVMGQYTANSRSIPDMNSV